MSRRAHHERVQGHRARHTSMRTRMKILDHRSRRISRQSSRPRAARRRAGSFRSIDARGRRYDRRSHRRPARRLPNRHDHRRPLHRLDCRPRCRRRLPPRGCRQRSGGGGIRPRHASQRRRDPHAPRSVPASGEAATLRLHEHGCRLRRRLSRDCAGRPLGACLSRRMAPRKPSPSCWCTSIRGRDSSTASPAACRRWPSDPVRPTLPRLRSSAASSVSRSRVSTRSARCHSTRASGSASPDLAIGNLVHAARVQTADLGGPAQPQLPRVVGHTGGNAGQSRARRRRRAVRVCVRARSASCGSSAPGRARSTSAGRCGSDSVPIATSTRSFASSWPELAGVQTHQ